MTRRTKIVATLGPASSDPAVLERMIAAGMDVARLNFSHGSAEQHVERAQQVRDIAARLGRTVGILVDLQGPKIRIGKFAEGSVTLAEGDAFILDADCELGDHERVGLDYKELPENVAAGDTLLLDDGRIELTVDRVEGNQVYCVVGHGGVLSNNKGINRRGGGLTAPALTEKDFEGIKVAAQLSADFLAVSFPRSAVDMELARTVMRNAGGRSLLVAKIERAEAIPALDELLDASDAIMVARGDLAVEVGDAAVPGLQKKMILAARAKNKAVITATQMLESMISSPIPTRAEVSDVANAVLDGTDAVMLSAETAAGRFPVESIKAMNRICLEAEREVQVCPSVDLHQSTGTPVEETIAYAAVSAGRKLDVKAIATLTQSGMTALLVSRLSVDLPIYAMSPLVETRRKVTLFRGVYPVPFEQTSTDPTQVLYLAQDALKALGAVGDGDYIVITIGEPLGKSGGTNSMKIVKVGAYRKA